MKGYSGNWVVDNHFLFLLYTSHCPGAREWFQVAFRLERIYGMTTDII
jgi:hypothetical protein